jgi:hypothetical protein
MTHGGKRCAPSRSLAHSIDTGVEDGVDDVALGEGEGDAEALVSCWLRKLSGVARGSSSW